MNRVRAAAAALVIYAAGAGAPARLEPLHPGQSGAPADGRDPLTFTRDVAPIVVDACGGCHRPDGPAPFSLLTYTSVRQRARQIAEVTRTRFMPPWKAEPGSVEFLGQRRLTESEISTIERWVAEGAPEGDPRDLPRLPAWPAGWQLGVPDLVVTIPQPYLLEPGESDVFRIFAIRLPIDGPRYVRGLEFHPGNPRVVHHANLRLDHTAATRKLDEADSGPGYDGLMPRSAVYPDGHFLGWTPGQIAPLVPAELSWRLEPGADLVVQLHMQPTGALERVQPSIGLFFSREPPSRTPSIIRLGSQGIDIPAGDANYVVTDSYVLPVDVELHALQPHTHYRARDVRGTATLPDGTTRALIHIRDWDFRWQHVYRLVAPLALPSGTTLSMRYTFDNSDANPRNPQRPAERVFWGQRTMDEMGDLWFQVLARNDRDRATLNEQVWRKMTAEDIVGYETLIRVNPGDADLHDDVAVLYLETGDPGAAVEHFSASVSLKPGAAAAHFNLATALTIAGRLDAAVAAYRMALALEPAYSRAHNNLAGALLSLGRRPEALRHFREAIRTDSSNVEPYKNLSWTLASAAGATPADVDEAVRIAERAATLTRFEDPQVLDVLAVAQAAAGRFEDATGTAERALRLQPPPPLARQLRERLELYRSQRRLMLPDR